jgi:hypothetical protein
MTVGETLTQAQVNNLLTQLALQVRNVMDQIRMQQTPVLNMGQTGLEGLGYSSTDATTVLTLFGYLASLSQIYYGQLQQGGTGGTGAIEFDFDNALSAVWAGM